MTAVKLYRGEQGAAYHAQRTASLTDSVQAARADYFRDLIRLGTTVLDFGCGTGGILANLPAGVRIGIEINEAAAAEARGRLDAVYPTLAAVEPGSVDAVISYHALEHVDNPSGILCDIRRVLKPGALGRFVVPYESIFHRPEHRRWSPNDPDMHLHSWTPLTFGNLARVCGYEVLSVRIGPIAGAGRLGSIVGAAAARWIKAGRNAKLQLLMDVQEPHRD